MTLDKIVYADYHATTIMDSHVISKMHEAMCEVVGNPSSVQHNYGLIASQELRRCRELIASVIKGDPENLIFTSGATEANNLAIFSCYSDEFTTVYTTPYEHSSILDPIHSNFKTILYIPFKEDKVTVDLEKLIYELDRLPVSLLSIAYANNEIGTIFPIREIGEICRSRKIPFHVDATQALAWLDIDVKRDNIDFLTLSGHKCYGPKGVGALYVSDNVNVQNMFFGGKQESSKRPGTQNLHGIIGFAEAANICFADNVKDSQRIALIRSKIEKIFRENFQDLQFTINGGENRLPNNISITFYGLKEGLLDLVNYKIAVSDGAACHGGDVEMSHVLKALGHTEGSQTLRIGLGRFTTDEDGDVIAQTVVEAVEKLRDSKKD